MRIRPFSGKDFDPGCRLVGRIFHAQHEGHAMWYGADELCAHLSRTDQGFVAEDDQGELQGLALFASPRPEDRNAEMRNHWRQQRSVMAAMAKALGEDLRASTALLALEAAVMGEMENAQGSEGVGELVLIIVDGDARGQGIGAALLREGLDWLGERGASELRLVTDDGCDWQLYEHLGMRRLVEREVDSGLADVIYVYQGGIGSLAARLSGRGVVDAADAEGGLALIEADEGLDAELGSILDAHAASAGVRMRSYRYRLACDGRTVGGISAWSLGSDVHIDMLAVAEDRRGEGLGARLLAQVEARAKQDGCTTASVDTFSFQAPDYYPACGYEEVFRVRMDDGSERIYFSKRL